MFSSRHMQRLLPSIGRASSRLATAAPMMCFSGFGRSLPVGNRWLPMGSCNSNNITFPSMLSRNSIPNSSPAVSYLPSTPCQSAGSGISAQQTRGFASKKHKWVIRQSKGFRGRANRCFRIAIRRLEKSWQYAYRDRKVKKREFRKLWIQRVNAGVRQHGISYSRFIQMQGKSGVVLDRKILSGLAMYEPFSFKAVVDVVQKMSSAAGGTGK